MHRSMIHAASISALVAATGVAQAADAPLLPLDAGTYVVSDYTPCQEAPLAGVMQFDGHAFSGPHASSCHSVVLDHKGSSYRVRTKCTANGDGSPAAPHSETTAVRIESRTRLMLNHDGKDIEYALCPALH